MNNFEFEFNGKKLWYSRSIAVLGIVIAHDKIGFRYVLAVKRGKGTPDPDEVGKWCLPCGYLDFNESLEEAISRETFEETGIKIDEKWKLVGTDSNHNDKSQNVTLRYATILNKIPKINYKSNNEVSEVKFIRVINYIEYDWAFNHSDLIRKYCISLNWNKYGYELIEERLTKSEINEIAIKLDSIELIEKIKRINNKI